MDAKECTCCHRTLPLSRFSRRHDKPNATHLGQCMDCYNDKKRAYRAKRAAPAPSQSERLWERPTYERDCDAALNGWRNVAQCVPVGAMLGARL